MQITVRYENAVVVPAPTSAPISLKHNTNDFFYNEKKIDEIEVELGKTEDLGGSLEITTLGLTSGQRFDIDVATLAKTLAGVQDYRSGATWDGDGYSERMFVHYPQGAGQKADWLIKEKGAPGLKLRVIIRRNTH